MRVNEETLVLLISSLKAKERENQRIWFAALLINAKKLKINQDKRHLLTELIIHTSSMVRVEINYPYCWTTCPDMWQAELCGMWHQPLFPALTDTPEDRQRQVHDILSSGLDSVLSIAVWLSTNCHFGSVILLSTESDRCQKSLCDTRDKEKK